MYDPANRTAVLDQGDIDGEFAVLLDKLMRAVERVDEPKSAAADIRRMTGGEGLFRDDRDIRRQSREAGIMISSAAVSASVTGL